MIIIEGMDNSGKTTLCNHLKDRLDIPIYKGQIPKGRQGMIQFQMSAMYINQPMIYDRMRVVSEMVYGPIIRNENMFAKDGWFYINLLLKIRPLIIYCRPKDEYIYKFGSREQMEGVIDNSQKLLERYDQIMSGMVKLAERPILVYDWNNRDNIVSDCSMYVQEKLLKAFQVKTLQSMERNSG